VLSDQGYAVIRRDKARTYVALDYGESGGGHGHPDRLNLWLVVNDTRILEDVGTGSYVDPSLHWYRSTLAHNAPLPMMQSQARVSGDLIAYEDRGDFGWVLANATIDAHYISAERAAVVGPDYLIDELLWSGPPGTIIDLPIHIAGEAPSVLAWTKEPLVGADWPDAGFAYVSGATRSDEVTTAIIEGRIGSLTVRLWLAADHPFVLWRVRGPGPPNEEPRDFFVVRSHGVPTGRVRTVFDWSGALKQVRTTDEAILLDHRNG